MELSDEARNLVAQSQSLLPYADKDGIVCIPSVRGETPASERLLNLLAAAYKDEDINKILSELLSNADHAGKSLESWLRDKFFTQHYKLFGHRPFIWQIWDGLKDGFSVLVNYHKLDRKNLETLIYTYLGDWISKQKSAMMDGIEGAYFGDIRTMIPELSGQHIGIIRTPYRNYPDTVSELSGHRIELTN